MIRHPEHLTGVTNVLLSTSDGGKVRCNLGTAVDSGGIASNVACWANGDGFISVPNPPSDAGKCQALWVQEGDQKRITALRDYRFTEKGGALKEGDRAIVSDCDARFLLKRSKNELTLYTVNETDDDSTMLFDMNGSSGTNLMVNGKASISMTKDKIQLSVGGTVLELSESGATLFAKHFACNVGGANFGMLAPGVAPPVGAMSVLVGLSGVMGQPSTRFTFAV